MNKKSSRIKKFKQETSLKLLGRVIIETAVFFASFIVIYIVGYNFFSMYRPGRNGILYFILNDIIQNNLIPIFFLIFVVGFLIALMRSWLRTLGYLEKVLNATEEIFDSKNDLIELPVQLKEVENQMNKIKQNVKENQRIAKEEEQRKNDLIMYLAHDLKTPLTSVIGYLTLLRDESKISEELREKYLSISLGKAERLEDLINEFFEISRFSLSTSILELSNVNLTRMLEQLTYEFKPMFLNKNLSCILNITPDFMIRCDVNKMQRVFDNLLRNAVNYSFEDSSIEITVSEIERGIKFNFKNHGDTIPAEKLERIFEQFYRLDTARTTTSGGAGLGLAIAKQIVELHNGTISADSKDGITNFEFIIGALQ